jgi:hypothetical protein
MARQVQQYLDDSRRELCETRRLSSVLSVRYWSDHHAIQVGIPVSEVSMHVLREPRTNSSLFRVLHVCARCACHWKPSPHISSARLSSLVEPA